MSAARRPLASVLAEAGVASEEQLRLAVAEGMGSGERLGEIVLRRGWIDEAGLAQLLARQWGLVYLADEAAIVEQSASALLSAEEAERLGVCVLGFVEGLPLVAVAEPAEDRFAQVSSALGRECDFAVVSKSTLERLVAQRVTADREAQAARARAATAQAADDAEADRLLGERHRGNHLAGLGGASQACRRTPAANRGPALRPPRGDRRAPRGTCQGASER